MWALVPPHLKVGAFLVLAALVLVAGSVVYGKIYDRGYEAAVVVAQREKAKLRAANDAAIAEARKTMKAELDQLILNNKQVDTDVSKLDAQTDADPLALRGGISADGMRRIDAVN